jgi:thiamine-phosphate pyrophosphorylase
MSDDYACRLYLISPPHLPEGFAATLNDALSAGDVAAFQLRLKDTDEASIVAASRALRPICHAHGVAFILNDAVHLVAQVGADGVHLGQEDMNVREARKQLGEQAIIGISCHDSQHLAMEAGDGGADYVAFGAFYPTTSKSAEKLAQYGTPDTEIVEWWSTYTTIPCVAIGGMTPENCAPLVTAGADFVAVINAVWGHPQSPAEAVKAFNAAIKRGIKARGA